MKMQLISSVTVFGNEEALRFNNEIGVSQFLDTIPEEFEDEYVIEVEFVTMDLSRNEEDEYSIIELTVEEFRRDYE